MAEDPKLYLDEIDEVVERLKKLSFDWAKPMDHIRADLSNAIARSGAIK